MRRRSMHQRALRALRFLAVPLLAIVLCVPRPAGAAGPRDNAAPPPSTVYAGVSNVGAFRDVGPTDSWTGLSALPSTSDVLALATGDSAHWRDIYAGLAGGIYASHDGGASWAAGLPGHAVRSVLVAAGGRVFAGADHLYRSDDGGKSWLPTNVTGSIDALAQATGGGSTLYAGGGGRVWASRDGGMRWRPIGKRLPGNPTIADLAADAGGATVYAATNGGVWRWSATAQAASWAQLRGLPSKAATGVVVTAARVVAVVADDGLYLSADNGATWGRGLAGSLTALAQDPQQPDSLVVGDKDGAVRRSKDGGQTWGSLGGAVAGNDGNPIHALAIVQRIPLPVDPVADPGQAGVAYTNGHTVKGAFLDYWQANREALGNPETEQFADTRHGGATAQYFQKMELLQVGDKVAPAPLGAERQPGGVGVRAAYPVDARFKAYWTAHGGQAVFGPPISPPLNLPANDGTGRSYPVQYFRNARLEYRPGFDGYAVVPGNLGDQALQALGWL